MWVEFLALWGLLVKDGALFRKDGTAITETEIFVRVGVEDPSFPLR